MQIVETEAQYLYHMSLLYLWPRKIDPKIALQVVEADPGNSAQWGYHLWLLRCAAAHMKAMHGAHVSDVTERVRGILQCSRLKCEQIVEDETARLGKLQACAGQHTGSVEAGTMHFILSY